MNLVRIGRSIEAIIKDYERFLGPNFKHYPLSTYTYHPNLQLQIQKSAISSENRSQIGDDHWQVNGFRKYKFLMSLMRSVIRTYYWNGAPELIVTKRYQTDPLNLTINWSLQTNYYHEKKQKKSRPNDEWEGVSVYTLNGDDGKVVKHLIHNISPPPGYWLKFLLYYFATTQQTVPSPTFFKDEGKN